MTDFDKQLHDQLRHLIDDLTVAVDDDGHTLYAPKNTLMFSNFIAALIELMPTLAARAQPAQAVPSDVVRDAERYRWLRNESWAGYNTGKGTPSVYTVDGAGNRRMMLAEEAMDDAIDDAIDAAIAQQKGGV